MSKIIGLIPARYGSSRFPGKMLTEILGKPLIQRTYENAALCGILDKIIVATDDKRIYDCVTDFGGEAVMTSEGCPSGTDRLAEVAQAHPEVRSAACLVNIQGDWPCLEPEAMEAVVDVLLGDPLAAMGTAAIRLHDATRLYDPSQVKVVFDEEGRALYFSRSPIPYPRDIPRRGVIPPFKQFFGHLGIYSYRPDFLLEYASLPQTSLQQIEDLEQLRVLEHGATINIALVKASAISVDTPEDVKKVEEHIGSL